MTLYALAQQHKSKIEADELEKATTSRKWGVEEQQQSSTSDENFKLETCQLPSKSESPTPPTPLEETQQQQQQQQVCLLFP